MSRKYDPDDYHDSKNLLIRWIEGLRTRMILRSLRCQKEHTVLDVGCGKGHILRKVPGKRVGIDLSAHYLHHAKLRVPDAELFHGNAEELYRYFHEPFDRIYCSEVLEHTEHPEIVIRQMAYLLKPGGIMVLSIPNDELLDTIKGFLGGAYRLFFPQIAKSKNNEWHLHKLNPQKIRDMCADAGLRVESVIPVPLIPLRWVMRVGDGKVSPVGAQAIRPALYRARMGD